MSDQIEPWPPVKRGGRYYRRRNHRLDTMWRALVSGMLSF